MNIISLCNAVVEPIVHTQNKFINHLFLRMLCLVLMLHFCAEHYKSSLKECLDKKLECNYFDIKPITVHEV